MNNRVSQIILLCEDDPQERLVRSYLRECGVNTDPPNLLPVNASRVVHGGNVLWVIREFPKQLEACRRRHAAHANTMLIVVLDADHHEVNERRDQLLNASQLVAGDPAVVLIPKRHVETWIRSALGSAVNEVDDYKRPELKKAETRAAARQIHGWARNTPAPGPTCVMSLRAALPDWKHIG